MCFRNTSSVIGVRAYPKTSRSRGTSFRRQRLNNVGRIFFFAKSPSAPKTTTVPSSFRETGEIVLRTSSPNSDLDSSESEQSSDLLRSCGVERPRDNAPSRPAGQTSARPDRSAGGRAQNGNTSEDLNLARPRMMADAADVMPVASPVCPEIGPDIKREHAAAEIAPKRQRREVRTAISYRFCAGRGPGGRKCLRPTHSSTTHAHM
eukprot:scaffold8001_cov125-Isochrysis_galbana.AAC.2